MSQYHGAEDTDKRKRRLKSVKKQILELFSFNLLKFFPRTVGFH